MLKQETITQIAKLLKLDESALLTAIKDEKEVDVAIDDKLTLYTEDEIATIKSNTYKEGKKAGEEMAVDAVKKEMELEFTGKTVKGLADAVAKKTLADAKIEPEKKVQELTEKLATVQKSYGELETKLKEKDTEVETIKINGELYKNVPAANIASDKLIALMKLDNYEFKMVDGKLTAFKDGKELQDKVSNPRPVADVISEYAQANKLIADNKTAGGRGGGDGKGSPGVYTKYSEIKAAFEKEGKSTLGQEFNNAVMEAAKVDGFDMNS